MDFSVTILGSNSAAPAHNRNQTSQLVNIGKSSILVDCGEGAQIQLRKFGIKTGNLDYILISHLHGDHYLGLMGVISTFHLNKRSKPLTIYGPKGLDEIITIQLKYGNLKLNFPLHFVQTDPYHKTLIIDEKSFKIFSFPTKHRIACTGFIIREKPKPRNLVKDELLKHNIGIEAINTLKSGKNVLDPITHQVIYSLEKFTYPPLPERTYAYSADTIYDRDLINYFTGADLLYHESTFMEKEAERATETFHSTAAQAATIAKESGVKKLLLGHFSIRYKELDEMLIEAREIFPNAELSIEGKTFYIEEWL
ncbi:ribonuclease Z [Anditalea andensis]|uniref:Ribonuclease Z n=1 Tax=Anditalea andensis TaxID=1048983 RepID=A0A074KY87_9BACT|nr:ribonuclease Z [Anditalea andensis]KEO72558.1 ribonuclease Z [Anditalea andensis]